MHFSTSARKWGMFNLPALRGVKWKSKLQQSPVINCRFCLRKIVRIRGLCDYPSMAPSLIVSEIAAALYFKVIITSPREYESYNRSLMST